VTPTRRRSSATAPDARKLLASLFKGKRAKWLPLFQRLLARLSQLPTIEAIPMRGSIRLIGEGGSTPTIGNVKVTQEGLILGLALSKAAIKPGRLKRTTSGPKRITHFVCLTEPTDIDAELLVWLKAALAGARTSKRRPT
jgi:hypothetical protein